MTHNPIVESQTPIHDMFGLTYASFLTLPRVLMEAMPLEWQRQMVELVTQADAEFANTPYVSYRVQAVGPSGKLEKMPDGLKNYRHPDRAFIDSCRAKD